MDLATASLEVSALCALLQELSDKFRLLPTSIPEVNMVWYVLSHEAVAHEKKQYNMFTSHALTSTLKEEEERYRS